VAPPADLTIPRVEASPEGRNFTLAPNAQGVPEGMTSLSLRQADLGTTLHVGVKQPVDDEQRPFFPSEFSQELAWRGCTRHHGGHVAQDVGPAQADDGFSELAAIEPFSSFGPGAGSKR